MKPETTIIRRPGQPTQIITRQDGVRMIGFGERPYVVIGAGGTVLRRGMAATADEARERLKPQEGEALYVRCGA